MRSKKGELITISIFIMVAFLSYSAFFNLFHSGCKSDDDCPEDHYCGVDKECHEIPVVEKTVVQEKVSYDLQGPATILAFAVIIGAVILKWKLM